MLNPFRKFSQTARVDALACAAAMLLSACGGAAVPGSDPAFIDENLSGSVTDGAAGSAAQPQEELFDRRTGGAPEAEVPAALQEDPALAQSPEPAPLAPPAPAVASASAGAAAYVPAGVPDQPVQLPQA